jgi:HEAT repeat protein
MRSTVIRCSLLAALWLIVGRAVASDVEVEKRLAVLKNPDSDTTKVLIAREELKGMKNKAKDVVAAMIELLDASPKRTYDAAGVLEAFGPEAAKAIPALVKKLQDPEAVVYRGACVKALIKIGWDPNDHLDALTAVIKEDGKVVGAELSRWEAIRHVGELGPKAKKLAPALVDVIQANKDNNKQITLLMECVRALGKLDPDPKEPALAALDALRTNPNGDVAGAAKKAYLRVGKDPAELAKEMERLAALYKSSFDKAVVSNEIQEWGPLASAAVPGLMEVYKQPSKGNAARYEIPKILIKIGPGAREAATPGLLERLKDKACWENYELPQLMKCLEAIEADPAAVAPALIETLSDYVTPGTKRYPNLNSPGDVGTYEIEVCNYLARMGPRAKAAVPALTKIAVIYQKTQGLGTADSGVGPAAIKALGSIGPDAKEALPVLRPFMTKRGTTAADVSMTAVAKITGAMALDEPKPKDGGDKPKDGGDKPKDGAKPKDGGDKPKEPDVKITEPAKPSDAATLKELTSRDPETRAKALEAVVKKGADGVPTLQAALKDGDAETKATMLAALGRAGSGAIPAVKDMKEALKDASPAVRRAAAAALAAVGVGAAREATEALTEALSDSDRETRALAAYALEKLKGG